MPEGRSTNDDFTVVVDDEGIVELAWAPGTLVSESVARAALAAVNALCTEGRRPMLVTGEQATGLPKDGRAVFEEPNLVSRIALLGHSPVDRVVANFILTMMRQTCPMRYFTDRERAMAFLREGLTPGGSDDAG